MGQRTMTYHPLPKAPRRASANEAYRRGMPAALRLGDHELAPDQPTLSSSWKIRLDQPGVLRPCPLPDANRVVHRCHPSAFHGTR